MAQIKRITVLTALPQEIKGLCKTLQLRLHGNVYQGRYKHLEVHAHCTGAGTVNAAAAVRNIIDKVRPHILIAGGIAGSACRTISPLSVVIGSSASFYDVDVRIMGMPLGALSRKDAHIWHAHAPAVRTLYTHLQKAHTGTVVCGHIVTGNMLLHAGLLQELPRAWQNAVNGASAVDMESAAAAQVCSQHAVPWVAVRIISDILMKNMRFSEACIQAGKVLCEVVYALT